MPRKRRKVISQRNVTENVILMLPPLAMSIVDFSSTQEWFDDSIHKEAESVFGDWLDVSESGVSKRPKVKKCIQKTDDIVSDIIEMSKGSYERGSFKNQLDTLVSNYRSARSLVNNSPFLR